MIVATRRAFVPAFVRAMFADGAQVETIRAPLRTSAEIRGAKRPSESEAS